MEDMRMSEGDNWGKMWASEEISWDWCGEYVGNLWEDVIEGGRMPEVINFKKCENFQGVMLKISEFLRWHNVEDF